MSSPRVLIGFFLNVPCEYENAVLCYGAACCLAIPTKDLYDMQGDKPDGGKAEQKSY